MKINRYKAPGLVEITPAKFKDSRGSFQESFNIRAFKEHRLETEFVQENESVSTSGVFRGFHLQKSPFAQGKLVRVISGLALDVVIDLRKSSPTYKTIFSIVLDPIKGNMLYVPPGFAHGFLALESTIFSYKCTDFYNKESESGIQLHSLNLGKLFRKYKHDVKKVHLSEKDKSLPTLDELLLELTGSQYS